MLSPITASLLLFLAILLTVSVAGALLITRFIPSQSRVALRPVTQPALTVVGMMFSILVGFFIAQSMRDYSTAAQNEVQEANAVASIFRLARGLDETHRKRIRGLCRTYVDAVLDEEWKVLKENDESEKAWEANQQLWEAVLSVTPSNERQQIACHNLVKAMENFGERRRARIGTNAGGLSMHLWAFIAIGASAIICITYMFAPESKAFHTGIICCIGVPLLVNVYLLSECSYPFDGVVSLKPTMFTLLRQRILTQQDTAPSYLKGQ